MTWRDKLAEYRNRLVADDSFRRRLSGLPIFGWLARRRAQHVFDLVSGFVYSQVLYACVQSGLLELLQSESCTASYASQRKGLAPAAAGTLLRAAAAIGLVELNSSGEYRLSAMGSAVQSQPGVLAMIAHHRLLYRDLAEPLTLFGPQAANSQTRRFWAYAHSADASLLSDEDVALYSTLMTQSQSAIAADVLALYPDFSRCRCVLDVGGGEGEFVIQLAKRYPSLSLMHFDLPAVSQRARNRVNTSGLGERVSIHAGNFLAGDLPRGADTITLVRIAHDHDDAALITLLQAVYDALPSAGRLLIAEPLSGIARKARIADAYFGMFFAAMGQGRTRSGDDIRRLCRQVGFKRIRVIPGNQTLMTSLLVAHK
jgi:demethylspheroidene O-methyltransferase